MPTTVVPTIIPVPPINIGSTSSYKLPDYKVASEHIISKNDDDLCWQHAAQYSRKDVKTCADLRVDVYKYQDESRNEIFIAIFVMLFLVIAVFFICKKMSEH